MKLKKCRNISCRKEFQQYNSLQKYCVECAIKKGKEKVAKKQRKEQREFRDDDIRTLKKRARYYCHKFIRLRDKDEPCISCGKIFKHGETTHASHYMSDGNNSRTRYDERNIHKSCVKCNAYQSGNLANYRIRLIEKIGIDDVLDLERKDEIKKWKKEDLKEIIENYKEKIKIMS